VSAEVLTGCDIGFPYGLRPGRGQHDALDALSVGMNRAKLNWVVDAVIERFFDTVDHDWLLRFVAHRIGDLRFMPLIRQWLRAGVMEDGSIKENVGGHAAGCGDLAIFGKHLSALCI